MNGTVNTAYAPAAETSKPLVKKQLKSFGLAGIANTAFDFAVLNILLFAAGVPILLANIIATTAAMALSFKLNNSWVFSGNSVSRTRSIVLFVLVTAFGLYVIQSIIIRASLTVFTLPLDIAVWIAETLRIGLAEDVVRANAAKLLATVATLIWNFILYKKVVFKS